MNKKLKGTTHSSKGSLISIINESKNYKYALIILGVILLLTTFIFSGSLNNDFITNWDDKGYIIDNEYVKDLSLEGIVNIFANYDYSNYHPITILTYALEYKMFGLNPKAYHISNLLLHLLNIILVYFFVSLLCKKRVIALVTALLFAIHPMHVESIAWISERKDLLYALFFIGALISYLFYLKKPKSYKYLILTFVLFALSLMSKSAAVIFPVALFAVDYYYKRKIRLNNLLEKLPFFILSGIFGYINIIAQKAGGAIDTAPIYGFFDKIFLVSYSIVFYIIKLFIPGDLSALHYYPDKVGGLFPLEYYIAPILLILIIWAIYKNRLYKREIIFGTLFFIITIGLTIQIIPFGQAIVSERYTYIPYIGLFFIIGLIYNNILETKNYSIKKLIPYVSLSIIGAVIILSVLTIERNKVWKNGNILFTDVINKYPDKAYGYYNRAAYKLHKNDLKGAISDFNKAIDAYPNYFDAYINRGVTKQKANQYSEAIIDFNKAETIIPNHPNIYLNRGGSKFSLKNYDGAIRDFTIAISLNPEETKAYFNRGLVYSQLNNLDAAIEDFNKASSLNPKFANACHNCGIAKYKLKQYKEAIIEFNKTIKINPNFAEAYHNRGTAKCGINKYAEAILDFSKTIKLNSKHSLAYFYRGTAKYYIKNQEGALNDWQIASKLGNKQAQNALLQVSR